MPRFKIETPITQGMTEYLRTKPVVEVEALLSTIASKSNDEVKMFEQEELVPLLSYISSKPYSEVHHILNRVFTYKEDGSFSISPEPEEVPVIQPEVQVVIPEVVASPPETSLETSADVQ